MKFTNEVGFLQEVARDDRLQIIGQTYQGSNGCTPIRAEIQLISPSPSGGNAEVLRRAEREFESNKMAEAVAWLRAQGSGIHSSFDWY